MLWSQHTLHLFVSEVWKRSHPRITGGCCRPAGAATSNKNREVPKQPELCRNSNSPEPRDERMTMLAMAWILYPLTHGLPRQSVLHARNQVDLMCL